MTPEGEVEAYLVEQVEAAGGFVRKVKWIQHNKAPDRYVSVPGFPGWTGFVEVKRPGESADAGQAREHKRMRDAGTNVLVLNCKVNIDIFMDRVAHGQVIYSDMQIALKERNVK